MMVPYEARNLKKTYDGDATTQAALDRVLDKVDDCMAHKKMITYDIFRDAVLRDTEVDVLHPHPSSA